MMPDTTEEQADFPVQRILREVDQWNLPARRASNSRSAGPLPPMSPAPTPKMSAGGRPKIIPKSTTWCRCSRKLPTGRSWIVSRPQPPSFRCLACVLLASLARAPASPCGRSPWIYVTLLGSPLMRNGISVESPDFSVVTDAGVKRGTGNRHALRANALAFSGPLLTKVNIKNVYANANLSPSAMPKSFRHIGAPAERKAGTACRVGFRSVSYPGETASSNALTRPPRTPWSVVFYEYAHQLINWVLTARVVTVV